jgi:transcription elongation factor GreA
MKYLTQEGFDKLISELEERKMHIRQQIAKAIKEAKEQGDLSENAEYSEAKRQQGENESRIMQLENLIRTSKVMKRDARSDKVQLGSTIDVEFGGKKMTFTLVGSNEADPVNGKISNESPMGRAFMGQKQGAEVSVELPNKKVVSYKILEIR